MNKRSYKDIEEEMKQLANAYEAPFDEQAWVRMEALLDKDKDRKRPPFFWFWCLLPIVVAGVAGGFYLYNNNEANKAQTFSISKTDTALLDKQNPVNAVISKIPGVSEMNSYNSKEDRILKPGAEQVIAAEKKSVTAQKAGLSNDIKTGTDSQKSNDKFYSSGKKTQQSKSKSRIKMKAAEPVSDYTKKTDQLEKQSAIIQDNNEPYADNAKTKESLPVVKNDAFNELTKTMNDSLVNKELVIADSLKKQTVETAGKKETGKANKKYKRGIYFIAAAGADADGVKLFSFDKITSRFGIAVGYQFSRRLSVQTGFFTGNKKYIAGPGDYTAKAGTYWSVVDITKVDASCRVYEIPLILRYDFHNSNKNNLFISAGLSSYIMKKEDYHYYYYRYGSLRDANASYTGNQHLFSVMRVAAGFERKISGPFSLQLSPGISVPLAGVGEGQVKLYSTDLMIGLKFTPDRKK